MDSIALELRRRWLQPAAPQAHTVDFYVWKMEWDAAQGKNTAKKYRVSSTEVGHGGSVSFHAELRSWPVTVTAQSSTGVVSGSGGDFTVSGVDRDGDVTVSFATGQDGLWENQIRDTLIFRITGCDEPTSGGEAEEMDELVAEMRKRAPPRTWST